MMDEMKKTVFKGKSFKYHQVGGDGKRATIVVKAELR